MFFVLPYFQREQLKKEIISKGKERKCLIDWGNHFQPHSFIHLLSDGLTNRVFMKWLTQWKPLLFHVSVSISLFFRLRPIQVQQRSIPFLLSIFICLLMFSSVLNVTKEGFMLPPVVLSLLFVLNIVQIFLHPSLSVHSIRSM